MRKDLDRKLSAPRRDDSCDRRVGRYEVLMVVILTTLTVKA